MNDLDIAVLEFMKESGFTAIYTKKTLGEYDPATGTVSETVKNIPVEAIMMDFTLQSNGLGAKYGTEILAGDKQMFIRPPNKTQEGVPPLSIDPTTDTVKVGSVEYKIVTMKEINTTGDNVLLFELLLRR